MLKWLALAASALLVGVASGADTVYIPSTGIEVINGTTYIDLTETSGKELREAFWTANSDTSTDPMKTYNFVITGAGSYTCSDMETTLIEDFGTEDTNDSGYNYLFAIRPEERYVGDKAVVSMDHEKLYTSINIDFQQAKIYFNNTGDIRGDGSYECDCEGNVIMRLGAEYELGRFEGNMKDQFNRTGELQIDMESNCQSLPTASFTPYDEDHDLVMVDDGLFSPSNWMIAEYDDGVTRSAEVDFKRNYYGRFSGRDDRVIGVAVGRTDSFGAEMYGAIFSGWKTAIMVRGTMAMRVVSSRFNFSTGPAFVSGDGVNGAQPVFHTNCGYTGTDCNDPAGYDATGTSGMSFELNTIEGSTELIVTHGYVTDFYMGPNQHLESTGDDPVVFDIGTCSVLGNNCTANNPCGGGEGTCTLADYPEWNFIDIVDANDIQWCNEEDHDFVCPGTDWYDPDTGCSCEKKAGGTNPSAKILSAISMPMGSFENATAVGASVIPAANHCDCQLFTLPYTIEEIDGVRIRVVNTDVDDDAEVGIYSKDGATQYFEDDFVVTSGGNKLTVNEIDPAPEMPPGEYWICLSTDLAASVQWTVSRDNSAVTGNHGAIAHNQTDCTSGELPATLTNSSGTYSSSQEMFWFGLDDDPGN